MKIAILGTRGIPAKYGGFETFAERLALGLTAMGFEVTVFCEKSISERVETLQGVKLRYCSAPALGPLQTILYDLKSLWSARREFDVVYMLGYGAAPFCYIPRLWGTEVWINPDGIEWARAKWGFFARLYFRLMEWTALRTANRIIADAEAIATSLRSRHRNLSACTVIPYGCDLIEAPPSAHALCEWGLEPNDYYLVVCRLEPENHILEIVEGFQRSGSSRQLVIVGDHLAKTSYVAQIRALTDSRIRFAGTVFDKERLTALRYYSFGYMHGHSVGGTNPSLLEAMGCGNLVFAHDNPFNRETLDVHGLFFKNAQQLAALIDSAETPTVDIAEFRIGAKGRAMARYTWPCIINAYEALLKLHNQETPVCSS
jgi:glycosyltransferase involved in cell wall biosynthesis